MHALPAVLLSGLAQLGAIATLLFATAGTFDYWQAWVFLAVFAVSAWLPSIWLQMTNPETLERRRRGGPAAEGRPVQKVVMAGLYLSLAAICAVSGLDRRFGWSAMPRALCVAGAVLTAAGLAMVVLVAVQNRYASTTVRVEEGQEVVSTGLYRVVRHPMYTANAIMLLGMPLALGSYWALVFVVTGLMVLIWRIRDEEQLLRTELRGYPEYTQKVRHRLLPGVW